MKGYIHIYTGNGKGKTTAAIGLAIRAIGAGKTVFFGQFVKGMVYSEITTLQMLTPHIKTKQYGLDCFIYHTPTQEDIDAARNGFKEIAEIIASDTYDIIILDEATIAIHYNLISEEEWIDLLTKKPARTEIIITGRYAPDKLIKFADLVTEMREIKHYYTSGIEARKGIEF